MGSTFHSPTGYSEKRERVPGQGSEVKANEIKGYMQTDQKTKKDLSSGDKGAESGVTGPEAAPSLAPEIQQIQQKPEAWHEVPEEPGVMEVVGAVSSVLGYIKTHAKDHTSQQQDQERTIIAKQNFLEIYAKTMGTITVAAEKAGIERTTYYHWKRTDPEFKEALRQIDEMKADMVEDRIMKLIQQDDGPTIRWYAERTNPKFVSKQKIDHSVGGAKTLEELLDEDEAKLNGEDTTQKALPAGADRGAAEDTEQAEGNSTL